MLTLSQFKSLPKTEQELLIRYEQYSTRAFINSLVSDVVAFLHGDEAKAIMKKALAEIVKATAK